LLNIVSATTPTRTPLGLEPALEQKRPLGQRSQALGKCAHWLRFVSAGVP